MQPTETHREEVEQAAARPPWFWTAMIAQGTAAFILAILTSMFLASVLIGVSTGQDIDQWSVGLLPLLPFGWTVWRSGKMALRLWTGADKPSAVLSKNWGSALTLGIVTVLIGGLGYMALRQRFMLIEKAHSSEAVVYLRELQSREEAFRAGHGRFPTESELGALPALRYFTVSLTPSKDVPNSGRTVKLTRNNLDLQITRYGNYSVVYNSISAPHLDCADTPDPAACRKDLLAYK